MKNIPITRGLIQRREVTPLTNKLVMYVSWHEKDHTDSDFYEEVLEINRDQWEEIIKENLIGKEVNFRILFNGNVEIIFPKKLYSKDQIRIHLSAFNLAEHFIDKIVNTL